jgi:hypothetical protein
MARFISSPQCPDRLWVSPNLLSNGYRGRFPREQSGRSVKLTTHLHLVPRSRMVAVYLHSPVCLHGTGTTLHFYLLHICNLLVAVTASHHLRARNCQLPKKHCCWIQSLASSALVVSFQNIPYNSIPYKGLVQVVRFISWRILMKMFRPRVACPYCPVFIIVTISLKKHVRRMSVSTGV